MKSRAMVPREAYGVAVGVGAGVKEGMGVNTGAGLISTDGVGVDIAFGAQAASNIGNRQRDKKRRMVQTPKILTVIK